MWVQLYCMLPTDGPTSNETNESTDFREDELVRSVVKGLTLSYRIVFSFMCLMSLIAAKF